MKTSPSLPACIVALVFPFLAQPLPLFADVDFAHEIVPILKSHCIKCHGGDEREGEYSMNHRDSFLKGGERSPAVLPGKSSMSYLMQLVTTNDKEKQMPPEGERLSAAQVRKLAEWIDQGAPWEEGFTFAKNTYEPPLRPRHPEVPTAVKGRSHPIDRFLDKATLASQEKIPEEADDLTFARRAWLDLIGLLPPPEALQEFVEEKSEGKRDRLIAKLLSDNRNYAEHWLTFWNDLLRNDYGGTGFITGGRKQISAWLYRALIDNKPYHEMVRELISPSAESAGFSEGIRWRGTVSAGQTVEIQFAQSVGQSFLGINLKCASCHDSFIDRWKLEDAYGIAAIYSKTPLDVHRCDKPIGKQAAPAWLFPELGTIDPKASQPERLKQLSQLMTHKDNGRFTRTIVNRLWHRLMGRGIVEPVDAMQTKPWNEDLLDWLAVDFQEHGYDLKHTIARICTSKAYQSKVETVLDDNATQAYRYRGPRAKRMTAEQFIDTVWQLTEASPSEYDAPILRGESGSASIGEPLKSRWVWNRVDAGQSPENEKVTMRKTFELKTIPERAALVATCDNEFDLFLNGKKILAGSQWDRIKGTIIVKNLRVGKNEFLFAGRNGGNAPNPAGALLEARLSFEDGTALTIGTDEQWEWTHDVPEKNGKMKGESEWKRVSLVGSPEIWMSKVDGDLRKQLAMASLSQEWMVRASLLKCDPLQKTLGRPNRDQIVTSRPSTWSTLEALDLSNAQVLDGYLQKGAAHWMETGASSQKLIEQLYRFALSRPPTNQERQVAIEAIGTSPTEERLQDFLWSLVMLPEFQLNH